MIDFVTCVLAWCCMVLFHDVPGDRALAYVIVGATVVVTMRAFCKAAQRKLDAYASDLRSTQDYLDQMNRQANRDPFR